MYNINNYLCRLTKLREYTVPTQMNSASLHPDCSIFVCGGEDLKMYKFDYTTGTEIGKLAYHVERILTLFVIID